jgi:hypothetical protein
MRVLGFSVLCTLVFTTFVMLDGRGPPPAPVVDVA